MSKPQVKTFLAWKPKWNQERREISPARGRIWACLTKRVVSVIQHPYQMLPSGVRGINCFWEMLKQSDERTHLAVVFWGEQWWMSELHGIGGNPLNWTPKLLPNDVASWQSHQALPRCYSLRPLDLGSFPLHDQSSEHSLFHAMIRKADDQLNYLHESWIKMKTSSKRV